MLEDNLDVIFCGFVVLLGALLWVVLLPLTKSASRRRHRQLVRRVPRIASLKAAPQKPAEAMAICVPSIPIRGALSEKTDEREATSFEPRSRLRSYPARARNDG